MAIRSKPRQETAPVTNERAVEAFIGKGGGVTKPASTAKNFTRHQLRLPDDLLSRIEAVRPKGIATPSRHDWFLQAVMEKLEREEIAPVTRKEEQG
jgi:hypothetical protein